MRRRTTNVQFVAPLIRPTREHPSKEKSLPRETVPLPTQGLEDQRLAQRVERALCATGYGALRTVRVTVSERVVVLGGRVSSYYLKQVAQATALAVSAAHQIRNDLHVVKAK